MIPRTPRSTLTDTLFPDTTLFRSVGAARYLAHRQRCAEADAHRLQRARPAQEDRGRIRPAGPRAGGRTAAGRHRSEEHTSELQSLMRISYAVFCLKKKKRNNDYSVICRHKRSHEQ